MKWMLIIVALFSLISIFELHAEYKKNILLKKAYTIIAAMESAAIVISLILFFAF